MCLVTIVGFSVFWYERKKTVLTARLKLLPKSVDVPLEPLVRLISG
jgi:hypothetical protein